jgi:peroxiredoxin family protein/rhodanese-related sulfurtransferase/TusA-related sulfurtransferase
LTNLEHAYAPPFSSAKDPVAISGYVAGNVLNGKMTPLYWRELRDADLSKVTLVDVRTVEEFELGTIPGAINIPLDDLRGRIREIPKDKPVYLFCGVGLRGYLASNILKANGYSDVRNLIGGIRTYLSAVTPVCRPDIKGDDFAKCVCESQAPVYADDVVRVDACGLQCPGPILKMKQAAGALLPGQQLEVRSTDAAFVRDAQAWCSSTGYKFLRNRSESGVHYVTIEKASAQCTLPQGGAHIPGGDAGKTFIMFSDDLDKVLATFILANGAAATGKKVSIFFTFWGLAAIKKVHKPKVSKDIFGRMFGWMLPSNTKKLALSKLNMFGIGSRMMRYLMSKKGVDSLESLRQQALDNGVEFIACQMSMDVMGVKREELLDEVSVAGVATYMEKAEKSNLNLFI